MIQDYAKLALKNLRKRKLRSWLTILGIVISVAIIFVLISLSVGLKDAINEQFKTLGSDKFFIMPKGQLGAPGGGGAVELTTSDTDTIRKVLGVRAVSYVAAGNAKTEFDKKILYQMVVGIPMDKETKQVYLESANLKIDEGRFIDKGDSGKIMIGSDYKYKNVFGKPLKTGDSLIINGKIFRVVGVIAPIGNPSDDKNIIMTIEDFRVLFNSGERVDQIVVQVNSGENITEVADRTKNRLMKFRDVNDKTVDFTVTTPQELLASFDIILNIITAFLVGVAAISLLVGSIGIANTMYTSVLERTREIGTMKAIGAKNNDILMIFLIESGLIGLVGALIGLALGYGAAKTVEIIAINSLGTNLLKAAAPWWLVLGCLAFGFIIGSASGVFPAYRAAKVKPVDALRYE
ncbi:MAG: ABC transporter permease [archaeon]